MKNNIHKDLLPLALDLSELVYLENNPRQGNVDAISASYERFEQVKPIVIYDDDGTKIVIAGNHQVMAARALGWDKIAAIYFNGSRKKALEYALSDNRISELGTTDSDLVFGMLSDVIEGNEEYFSALGWDDFEIVAMQPEEVEENVEPSVGWEPPSLISRTEGEDGKEELTFAGTEEEESDLVSQGATSAGVSGKPNIVIQYTLVFDNPVQQKVWYDFLRWMKGKPDDYPGVTTTAQLVAFLESSDFRENQ
jgi:hypothetical protein